MSHVRLDQKLQNRNHFITKDALFFIIERQDDTFFFNHQVFCFFGGLKQCGLESLFYQTMSEILHQVIREHFVGMLPSCLLFLYQVTIFSVWWNYCVQSKVIGLCLTYLQLNVTGLHSRALLAKQRNQRSVEECPSFSSASFSLFPSLFFSALFLFFIKSFSRSQLPFLSQRKKLRSPAEHLFVCMGRTFFLFFLLAPLYLA